MARQIVWISVALRQQYMAPNGRLQCLRYGDLLERRLKLVIRISGVKLIHSNDFVRDEIKMKVRKAVMDDASEISAFLEQL